GRIAGWPDSIAGLAAEVEPTRLLRLDTLTDSAFIWTLLRQRMDRGRSVESVFADLVPEIAAVAPGFRLNLLAIDGEGVVATSGTHQLSAHADEDVAILASEPFGDDEQWREIPDGRLVIADRGEVHTHELSASPPQNPSWCSTFTVTGGSHDDATAVRDPV